MNTEVKKESESKRCCLSCGVEMTNGGLEEYCGDSGYCSKECYDAARDAGASRTLGKTASLMLAAATIGSFCEVPASRRRGGWVEPKRKKDAATLRRRAKNRAARSARKKNRRS